MIMMIIHNARPAEGEAVIEAEEQYREEEVSNNLDRHQESTSTHQPLASISIALSAAEQPPRRLGSVAAASASGASE